VVTDWSIVKDEQLTLLVNGSKNLHEVITDIKAGQLANQPETVTMPGAVTKILQDKTALTACIILIIIEVTGGIIVCAEGVTEYLLLTDITHVVDKNVKSTIGLS
jgi:hypothetical protein